MLFGVLIAATLLQPPRAALPYRDEIVREARFVWGLLPPAPAIGAQIEQESGYRPDVCSAFACGLAQFTPKTAEWISGAYARLGPAAPTNPQWAIRAMVTYDRHLFDAVAPFDSECDRWLFALSDYNGGSARRIARQSRSLKPGSFAVTGKINPGVSAVNQQQNETYGPRILYRLQPAYAAWGRTITCAGETP